MNSGTPTTPSSLTKEPPILGTYDIHKACRHVVTTPMRKQASNIAKCTEKAKQTNIRISKGEYLGYRIKAVV